MLSSRLMALLGLVGLAMAGYPEHYEVGYGFVTHGGVGAHGHYLPATARVKVHKDPFQSHYSLDEEGPTHYKYVRHSSSNHHPAPVVHHAQPLPVAGVIGGVGVAGVAGYPHPGVGVVAGGYPHAGAGIGVAGGYPHGGAGIVAAPYPGVGKVGVAGGVPYPGIAKVGVAGGYPHPGVGIAGGYPHAGISKVGVAGVPYPGAAVGFGGGNYFGGGGYGGFPNY